MITSNYYLLLTGTFHKKIFERKNNILNAISAPLVISRVHGIYFYFLNWKRPLTKWELYWHLSIYGNTFNIAEEKISPPHLMKNTI